MIGQDLHLWSGSEQLDIRELIGEEPFNDTTKPFYQGNPGAM